MLTARDIMTPAPVTIRPDASVREAVSILLEKRFNGLPVIDESGELVGVICQSDLIAQQKKLETPSVFSLLDGFIPFGLGTAEKDFKKIAALTVADAMSQDPVTAAPDTPIEDLATLMVKSKYYSLPVVQNKKVVGIVGKEDILRTLVDE